MKKIHEGEDVDRGLTSKGMESQFGPCGWGWYPSISWTEEKESDVGRWGQACFGGKRRVKNTDMGVAELIVG